jgi:hypothetical protein
MGKDIQPEQGEQGEPDPTTRRRAAEEEAQKSDHRQQKAGPLDSVDGDGGPRLAASRPMTGKPKDESDQQEQKAGAGE